MKNKYLLLFAISFFPAGAFAQTKPGAEAVETATKEDDELKNGKAPIVKQINVTVEEEQLIKDFRSNTIILPASTTTTFKATVLNTNFIIPIVRFNSINSGPTSNQKGNVSIFNSIGAGISINAGRLEVTTDAKSKVINREMDNTFGFQLGILFASNAGSNNDTNIFAPTMSVSALDFQLGLGYELGSVAANEDRFFYTLAYGIPIAKLVRKGFYVLKKTPLPINTSNGFN